MRPKAEWAIDSEASYEGERNNCFSKIHLVGQKLSRLTIFRKLKLDINPFLPPKHCKYGERFSLLVGYTIYE